MDVECHSQVHVFEYLVPGRCWCLGSLLNLQEVQQLEEAGHWGLSFRFIADLAFCVVLTLDPLGEQPPMFLLQTWAAPLTTLYCQDGVQLLQLHELKQTSIPPFFFFSSVYFVTMMRKMMNSVNNHGFLKFCPLQLKSKDSSVLNWCVTGLSLGAVSHTWRILHT